MLRRWFSIAGQATVKGTEFFKSRNPNVAKSHWRKTSTGLTISSLGIGTYMGAPDNETDALVKNAIVKSVSSGMFNIIDTAINYRYQKAERSVGSALKQLIKEVGFKREELFISSKIGYVPEDADKKIPGKTIISDLIKKKLIQDTDVPGGIHCMHPAFLKDQLDKSLNNLGLQTIDLLYLHNTAESQMPQIHEPIYWERLKNAIEFCENAIKVKKIVNYGLATWMCFRSPISDHDMHLSLERVVRLAESIAGPDHGMKYIQVPINLMMPEAFIQKWQEFRGTEEILLNVAKELGVNVIASSPLLQGKLLDIKLLKTMAGIDSHVCKQLQLLRSIPSGSLKSVLVGMKNPKNIMKNLQIPFAETLAPEEFWAVLKPEVRDNAPLAIDLW
ncbi:hypothetical protein SteCoe_9571 [Stentor coeruleus]|uniref:NADP-dependent oxidoreductase domain-containing protein n=1 Tax=Stentor coeruleus TaxID=5963 RepID=A0A1R2CHQ6_9CILI|nr:hypothetical protein SteCoe_9571 [Stentor coeruleus]